MEKIEIKTLEQKSILTRAILENSRVPKQEIQRYSKEFLLSLRKSSTTKDLGELLNFRSRLSMSLGSQPSYLDSVSGSVIDTDWKEEVDQGCTIVKVRRFENNSLNNSDSCQDFISIPKRRWKKNLEKDSRHFMVLCWNLLAPFYASEEKFYLTKSRDLDWSERKRRILDEIIYYSPDFVCLQVN
jgi:hypothetical protein